MSIPDNTPVQADALVERLEAWADSDSQYGHHARAEDLYAAVAILAHQPTTDAEAERKVLQDAADYITDCILAGGAVRSKVLRYLIFTLAPKLAHPPADKARIAELTSLLREAVLQLQYMDERSPSGTTPTIVSRINAALKDAPHAD